MAPIQFQVVHTRKQVQGPREGVFLLEPGAWDDYGVKCSFLLVPSETSEQPIGTWKIIDSRNPHEPRTDLPPRFSKLPPHYVALGQHVDAYQRIAALPPSRARSILDGLGDLVYRPRPQLQQALWFTRTLGRFASARTALDRGRRVLGQAKLLTTATTILPAPDTLDLRVRATLQGFRSPHELSFSFSRAEHECGIRRMVVLIGPNGSGKTQLLAALASSLSGLEVNEASIVPDKPFTRVIAVSYGAFDHFMVPRMSNAPISYVYCGLRVPPDRDARGIGAARRHVHDERRYTLDLDLAIEEGVMQMLALDAGSARAVWREALQLVELGSLLDAVKRGRTATERCMREQLSAGQKLVALTISNVAAHLQPGSIVLHDEPETHLHPNLLSALLRAMRVLLHHFDSFAIIATHSIIPAQETPARNVVILDRYDEDTVRAFHPPEQCFASTLDEITRMVFRTSPEDQNFRTLLSELRAEHGVDKIRDILGGELSLGMQLWLAAQEP